MRTLLILLTLIGAGAQGAPVSKPTLEERVQRLQSTLDQFIDLQRAQRQQVINYESCTDYCLKVYPWPKTSVNESRELETEPDRFTAARKTCFSRCDQDKPPGVGGC